MDIHRQCTLVNFPPIGKIHSCAVNHLKDLAVLISHSQSYIPSLSADLLLSSDNVEAIFTQDFGPSPSWEHKNSYSEFQLQIKRLGDVENLLSRSPNIEKSLASCLESHGTSLDAISAAILRNLRRLQPCILQMKLRTENVLFQALDAHPEKTADILKSIMKLVCLCNTARTFSDSFTDNKELKGESTTPASSKLRNDWCRTMDRRRGHKLFRGEVVLEILYHSGIQYMVRR